MTSSSQPRRDAEGIRGLVDAAVDGDRRAVQSLLAIIRPLVVRYCRPRVSTERAGMSADDVAQEVCLAVLKALPSYREQGRPFLAFVYGIAAHKVVEAHRVAARDRSDPIGDLPEEVDLQAGPEQAAVALSESADMRRLLEQLPAKQRDILVLRNVVGLSAEETADAVGSTPGAVRVAQYRGLRKLRQLLALPTRDRTALAATAVAVGNAAGPERFALVDEVFADPQAEALDELTESIDGTDPKEFRAHSALLEDIADSLDMSSPAAHLAEAYRHRQLTKDLSQNLGRHVDAGVRAVLSTRRREAARDEPL